MSYIGNTATTQSFIAAVDFFSGNGSTVAFTLSRPVASVAQVQATISNVPQSPGNAYTVSGNTITFTSAPPSGTNNIYVYYTSPITQVIAPGQGTVGTTQLQNGLVGNFADGSAASPSITNDGDTNTGIFFPAADTIAFSEGGTEAMRLDSAGNMGLGVTPSAWGTANSERALQLTGGSLWSYSSFGLGLLNNAFYDSTGAYKYRNNGFATHYFISSNNGAHAWYTAASGTAGNTVSFTQAMTLDASGSLLVGYTSSNGVRAVFSNNANGLPATSGTTQTYGALRVRGGDNAVIDFGCNSTNTWIQATDLGGLGNGYNLLLNPNGGNLLVGTTTPLIGKMTVNGGITSTGYPQFNFYSTNSSTAFEWVMRSGTEQQFYVSNATVMARLTASGVWTDASDARYKENIRPVAYGLAEVMQLQPRAYNIIGSEKQEIGFVAQEVETILPELVESAMNSVTEEERLTLSYGQMSAVLVKAIQEQQAIIQTLTDRITALENK